MSEYKIRLMQPKDVDIAVQWAADEGWNPGLEDASVFFDADPTGFLIGELAGEPIACISVVKYGADFAFLGFYIVHPEQRGQGYGLRIWDAGMAAVAGRKVGLDGVVDQQDNYRKSGFRLAYRNIRYAGVVRHSAAAATGVVPVAKHPFAEIAAYDAALFPGPRADFLRSWLGGGRTAMAAVENGRLVGFGAVRPCRSGYKIGPLYADSERIASQLLDALQNCCESGQPLFLDVPEPNAAAVALAHRLEMAPVFETARMYTGVAPDIDLKRIFGVTTFELG